MRRLDTETIHTRQASYFGLISLVSFLVLNVTILAFRYTDRILPKVVVGITLILFSITSVLSLYHAFTSRAETDFSSRLRVITFSLLCIGCWVYLIGILPREVVSILSI